MDSDVVFNCGSESVINHNLFELRFFICLCRFGEKINNCRSVKRVRRSVKRVGRNFLYSVWILRTIFEKFRIHWGYYVQFLANFVFLRWSVYNMEFKWSLDENMCVLFAIMSALNAKQQAMVTVSRKIVELNNFELFADMYNM